MRPRNLTRVRLAAFAATLLASAMSSAVGCHSSASAPAQDETPDSGTSMPFQADPVTVYVAKVKNILVGLAADGRRDRGRAGGPHAARLAHRRLDAAAAVHREDDALLRAGVPADAGRLLGLRRQVYPEQIDINPTTSAAAAERAGELRAHDAAAHLPGAAAHAGDDDHAADDDHRAEGALRLPRRLGGRRRQQGHRRVQEREPEAEDHRRGGRRRHPHQRHARPDQRQLHALVRPRRRHGQLVGRRLRGRPDRLPGERDHAALPPLRVARRVDQLGRDQVPAVDGSPRRRSCSRATSPTGRWSPSARPAPARP